MNFLKNIQDSGLYYPRRFSRDENPENKALLEQIKAPVSE